MRKKQGQGKVFFPLQYFILEEIFDLEKKLPQFRNYVEKRLTKWITEILYYPEGKWKKRKTSATSSCNNY